MGLTNRSRKAWELSWIADHVCSRLLSPIDFEAPLAGRVGLGIAVGREALCGVFASLGAKLVLTDILPDEKIKEHWLDTGQHSGGDLENIPGLKPYLDQVEFQYYDMKDPIPDKWLGSFDFVWSANSVDHIGSIEEAIDFIVKSSAVLNPGGVMAHTTEYAIDGPEEASIDGDNSFMRLRDIQECLARMKGSGLEVPFHDAPDWSLVDEVIDEEPYHPDMHIKIRSGHCVVTCVGFVGLKP